MIIKTSNRIFNVFIISLFTWAAIWLTVNKNAVWYAKREFGVLDKRIYLWYPCYVTKRKKKRLLKWYNIERHVSCVSNICNSGAIECRTDAMKSSCLACSFSFFLSFFVNGLISFYIFFIGFLAVKVIVELHILDKNKIYQN